MRVNILHRSIFDGGLISGERGGHFINAREGQSLRIAMAGHAFERGLIPATVFVKFEATSCHVDGLTRLTPTVVLHCKNTS